MRRNDALGVVGIGALAVVCCAALPAAVAFAGGLTVVALLGVCLAVGATAALIVRARRRHAQPTATGRQAQS
jgi:predicted phage tail protein